MMPGSGLKLLTDTLKDETPNSVALGRVLNAIDKGTLTINGQSPDKAYSIGEYLIHGGRIKFDVSDLNSQQQSNFFNYVTNEQAKNRTFSTHRAGGTDASGSPAESKSGIFGAISDMFRGAGATIGIVNSKHYGINLAIGGTKEDNQVGKNQGVKPQENGEWGHMYLYKDSNILLVGIEPSATGLTNKRTDEAHSKTGASGELSPFLETKINSMALQQEQLAKGNEPLSVKEKYNWATIKITPAQLLKLESNVDDDNVTLVNKVPSDAITATPTRTAKMEAWAKATKQANKPSKIAKFMGLALATVGIVVAFVPIPVVAQLLGGAMTALGVGIAAGVVGISLFATDIRGSSSAAEKIYDKIIKKLHLDEPEDDSQVSNQFRGLYAIPPHNSHSRERLLSADDNSSDNQQTIHRRNQCRLTTLEQVSSESSDEENNSPSSLKVG